MSGKLAIVFVSDSATLALVDATSRGAIMGVIEDVRKALADIPLWRELGKMPDRMAAMEARMAAMEDRLKTRPGETCPKCGEHTMRLSTLGRVIGGIGKQQRTDHWACSNPTCDHMEARLVKL
ncbi:hypothetical protein [Mesorhizobium sp. M0037]|uniref:hypothetical protein n=1 Tax=unclassified Mesorhizobium TaxID=325217 RepID=UPI00333A89C0